MSYWELNVIMCAVLLLIISVLVPIYPGLSSSLQIFLIRQMLHGSAGGMSPQVQARSQQFPGSSQVSVSFPPLLIIRKIIVVTDCKCADIYTHMNRTWRPNWILFWIQELQVLKDLWLESLVHPLKSISCIDLYDYAKLCTHCCKQKAVVGPGALPELFYVLWNGLKPPTNF